MPVNSNVNEDTQSELIQKQEACALLRERFLRLISHLSGGQHCMLRLCDLSDHTCIVRGFSSDFENIIVENLSTAYPEPVPRAIVRMNDVYSLHFNTHQLPNCHQ